MMKKNIVNCVVMFFVIAAVLVSCNKSAGSAGNGDEKVIEFWHIQNTSPAPEVIQAGIDRFEAANPDYKVNIVVNANDSYKQRLATAIASQQLPDVFFSWTGGATNEYIKAGLLSDLTPYFDQDNYKAKFLDGAIAQATVNGKIYGFPVEGVAIEGIWYNKELFAKYNVKLPTTISELEAACETFKANGIAPFSLANMTRWTGMMYYQILPARHAGLEPFQKALDGTGSFEDPAFIWAAEKVQEWVRKGYFNEGFNGLDEDSAQSRMLLYTDRAAMQMQGSWFAPTVAAENPAYYKKIGFMNFPADETGTGDPKIVTGTLGDNFYHIAADSPNKEKAFEMLTYLLDEQSVADRIGLGRIPPVKGVSLTDPVMQEVLTAVENAPAVQLWYDQALGPEVSEEMLSAAQELFGLTVTPQQFAKRWADAQKAALEK
jgi:raffinose/stachyose/melibiose transport system substrate-binding protein